MAGLLESAIPKLIITASIIFAGIIIGIGKAINNKKMERFGIEELVQALINAAIFGAAILIISTTADAGRSLQTAACQHGAVAIDELKCIIETRISPSLFTLFQENIKLLNIVGYYQTLNLNFVAFSIQPLSNMKAISDIISSQASSMQLGLMLISINLQIVAFISANALQLIFVLGLVFRMFFATRKLGGFLIALAFGLYLFYPSFILIFPDPTPTIEHAVNITRSFTNNSAYAVMPIVDLNNNNAIAQKIDLMSGKISNKTTNQTTGNLTADFSGDLTLVVQANSQSVANVYNYSVVASIFALIITIVFIKELGNILGGEISLFSII